MSFAFAGSIPASKSILNRLLILQSFSAGLKIHGDSTCDDVVAMKSALAQLNSLRDHSRSGLRNDPPDGRRDGRAHPIHCGAAGTTFRFIALRASRIPGRHFITGTKRLLERPQMPLVVLLRQLGVSASLSAEGLLIESDGWKKPSAPIVVNGELSSQFGSAVILSACGIDFDLELELQDGFRSESYFALSCALLRDAGVRYEREGKRILLPARSEISQPSMNAELDMSSAFAVAAMAAVAGHAEIHDFSPRSLQPDAIFPELLRAMGAPIQHVGSVLTISRAPALTGIDVDLGAAPDLFPVLAVLAAKACGRSRLFGAPQLVHKESNRIGSVGTLLERLGCGFKILSDGIELTGGADFSAAAPFSFDPQEDHRLAMAAAVANHAGARIRVTDPFVVNKSFPEFWTVARGECS